VPDVAHIMMPAQFEEDAVACHVTVEAWPPVTIMHHRGTLETIGNTVTVAVGRRCAIRTCNDKRRNRCRRHQGLLEKHLTLLFPSSLSSEGRSKGGRHSMTRNLAERS